MGDRGVSTWKSAANRRFPERYMGGCTRVVLLVKVCTCGRASRKLNLTIAGIVF
jgi:hypothetical protein